MSYWIGVAGTREQPLPDGWQNQVKKWLMKRGPVHMFAKRPDIHAGDRLVMYASGTPRRLGAGRIFAVREAVSGPQRSGEERWRWKVEVRDLVLGPPLPDCPTLADIGVKSTAVRRQAAIRLEPDAGFLAERLIERAASPGRGMSERLDDALLFAHELHRRQTRKGKDVPYISHLLGVASIVLEEGGSETQAIAALLHDAAEDQGGRSTLEAIRSRFGADVARIVEACTDTFEDPKPEWRARKEKYIEQLRHEPPDALLVSIADKVHNAGTLVQDLREHGPVYLDRFNGGREGTVWYYGTLAATFAGIPNFESRLVERLRGIAGEMETYLSAS
jgi:hypothetical protein